MAFLNLNLEILSKSIMLLITHNLPLMNCIYWLQLLPYHDFQIGLIIFQLASFSSKINVYPKQVVYGEKNTVQIAYMKRFLHTYLKYMVICIIRKIFLSVLLNLHQMYNGWHWGNVVVLSCPIYAKYFSDWHWEHCQK